MALLKLNTTTSIEDALRAQGKSSDFSSRQSLYKSSGLGDKFGAYTGSSNQNVALIKYVNAPSQTGEILKSPSPGPVDFSKTNLAASVKPKPDATTSILSSGGQGTPDWSKYQNNPTMSPLMGGAIFGNSPASSSLQVAQGGAPVQQPPPKQPEPDFTVPEYSASESPAFGATGTPTAADFGIGLPSEAELVEQYLASSEFNALKEANDLDALGLALKDETAKENLQAKYEADRQEVEETLGRNGLWFSGIRNTMVASLVQSLAMSTNQLDRATAVELLKSDAKFKQDILAGVEKLFTEAKNDNKEALGQLNQAGFVLIGNQIVPSLAAMKYQSDEENRKMTQELNILQFRQKLDEFDALERQRATSNGINYQKLKISQQNANTGAERNAILNQMRLIQLENLSAVSPGQIVNRATGRPVKLTAEQQSKFAGFSSMLLTQIPAITTSLDTVNTGGATGRFMTFAIDKPGLQNTLSNDQQALIQTMNQMNNSLIYLLSGKQINQQEFERLKLQLPSLNYNNSQNKTQIAAFSATLEDIYNRELGVQGWTVAGGLNLGLDVNMLEAASGGDSLEDLALEFEE